MTSVSGGGPPITDENVEQRAQEAWLDSSVTIVDWTIVAFTVVMAYWGFRQGLIVGLFSLAGFAAGAFAGSRLAPQLLPDGSESPYAPALALTGAVLVGGMVAVLLEELALRARGRVVRGEGARMLDGAGGAVLVAAIGLGLAWLLGAVALNAPGASDLRREAQRSVILRELNQILPPSAVLNTLNRIDPRLELEGPQPGVSAPDRAIARDPQVRAAGESVVKVIGTACGLGVSGSGWVAEPGVVVTNAHVIAGQDDTAVEERDGERLDADPVHYEPRNDLAVLRVDGVDGDPLAFGDPAPGTSGAVLGYPEDGPFAVTAARLGETQTAVSQDSYGRGPIERQLTVLRGAVREGNSGGPMVDGAGQVLTTVFAATVGGGRGGYGIPNGVVQRALSRAADEVGTGPCT